ncbi:MAG: hypothetical protein Rsou_1797 [Candidatus Ruthia sp. Asou_11_S2]|nr:hypothetical protein [Candidatus Ruthia sp. Asou_11_S2]
MVFSAIWGSALGAWLTKEKSFSYFLFALFLGMGLHASWNLFAIKNTTFHIYLFIAVSWIGLSFIKNQLQKVTHHN